MEFDITILVASLLGLLVLAVMYIRVLHSENEMLRRERDRLSFGDESEVIHVES